MITEKLITDKIIDSLEKGSFRKIICGASNTSAEQVEKLALIYSLCGVDVIDISANKEIETAAKRGIAKAAQIAEENPFAYTNFNYPAIMKSINAGDDKHFRKARFDLTKCMGCFECMKVCSAGALTEVKEGKPYLHTEKCYGCAKCFETCRQNAISMEKTDNRWAGGFDVVEIHTGNSSVEEVKNFIQANKIKEARLISVSVESMRFNSKEFVEYVDSVTKIFDKKIIVQVDGISMRGGTKETSTLQTIAAASILLESNINAYIQLAGGTNHQTQKIVDMTGLKISGIGYGTFSKKIILSYIEGLNEKKFPADIHKITEIARGLF